jgi:hypothetical protein
VTGFVVVEKFAVADFSTTVGVVEMFVSNDIHRTNVALFMTTTSTGHFVASVGFYEGYLTLTSRDVSKT